MNRYRFHCFPVGALSRVATKASLRGPIEAENAAGARAAVFDLMSKLYPAGGPWRMCIWNGSRQLRSTLFTITKNVRKDGER